MQASRHFLFYANATADIGSGHVMRLLAIAQACREHNLRLSFVHDECSAQLQQRLLDEGFTSQILARDLAKTNLADSLGSYAADAIFIDDYELKQSELTALSKLPALLVNLDDNLDGILPVGDIVVNPAADANEASYKAKLSEQNVQYCLGPRYTYLRQEFAEQAFIDIADRKQLLITLGGADVKNMAYPLAQALCQKLPDLKICLLLGSLNTSALSALEALSKEHNKLLLIQQSAQVAKLMMASGLAISAAGGTLGELASMGVPTLALVSSDNQQAALQSPLLNTWYQALDVRTYQEAAIIHEQHTLNREIIERIITQAYELWRDLCFRQQMSEFARQIIDTHGCERIVQCVLSELNKRQQH